MYPFAAKLVQPFTFAVLALALLGAARLLEAILLMVLVVKLAMWAVIRDMPAGRNARIRGRRKSGT